MSDGTPLTRRIRDARSLLAVTGAGISAESGIPTYRGVAGLYNADDGEEIMCQLSMSAYRQDPDATFARINSMLEHCLGARPNPAHLALARAGAWMDRLTVITQNVDGLHTAAGTTDVIEMHGNIRRLRCPGCGYREDVPDDSLPSAGECPACRRAPLRHDVVLFEEMLQPAVLDRFGAALREPYEVCLVIGTTGLFPYIQGAVLTARAAGAHVVEINPDPTPITEISDEVVRAPAGETLAPLLEC